VMIPERFYTVGQWYQDFPRQVTRTFATFSRRLLAANP